MNREDYIEEKTETAIRSASDILAPTCLGCPLAKVYVSEMTDPMRDGHKLKINFRCDKMGMIGRVCPDGGDPTRRYAKDIGMKRNLSEQQISYDFHLDNYRMAGFSSPETGKLLRGEGYMGLIKSKIEAQKHRIGERLHVFTEALNYASKYKDTDFEPIVWLGEDGYKTFSKAMGELEVGHKLEYRAEVEISSGICKPTTYMKKHLQPEFQSPFGIFVDYEGDKLRHGRGDVAFLGEDAPPPSREPETYMPEPTRDEIYEDWGSFG